MFDLDGNGKITNDEIVQVFANGSVTDTLKMNKPDIQKLMNEADVRHSQTFTSQERILRRVCVFLRVKLNWVTG